MQTIEIQNADNSSFHRFARLAGNPRKLRQLRQDSNARKLDAAVEALKRHDSATYSESSGLHLSRDLEHIYAEVLKADYPDNNALAFFPMDRSVKPGARTHTIRRLDVQGKAKVHRGRGDKITTVSLGMSEETFKILYYTIGVEWDHFEDMASRFADTNMLGESLTGARDIMLEFWNEKTWNGSPEHGLPGVLNYPYINKMVIAGTTFKHGGDAEAMLSALQALVDVPGELNKGKAILRPNRVIMSVRLKQIIEGTFFTGVAGPTVLSRLESSKNVKVESAWELQETGPGGTDQILVYKAGDKRSIANVAPIGFTQLATQQTGFTYSIPCFMSHGGVIMRKPLMNIIGYVDVE